MRPGGFDKLPRGARGDWSRHIEAGPKDSIRRRPLENYEKPWSHDEFSGLLSVKQQPDLKPNQEHRTTRNLDRLAFSTPNSLWCPTTEKQEKPFAYYNKVTGLFLFTLFFPVKQRRGHKYVSSPAQAPSSSRERCT